MLDSERLYLSIGEAMRRIREAQSPYMSQGALGKILDLKRTSITNIERGKQKPTLETLYRFCEHFRIQISELIPQVSDVTQAGAAARAVVVAGKSQELPSKTAALVSRLTRARR